jgi:hypothetical protein
MVKKQNGWLSIIMVDGKKNTKIVPETKLVSSRLKLTHIYNW